MPLGACPQKHMAEHEQAQAALLRDAETRSGEASRAVADAQTARTDAQAAAAKLRLIEGQLADANNQVWMGVCINVRASVYVVGWNGALGV